MTTQPIDFSGTQLVMIYTYIQDERWHTLRDIEDATNQPQSSISAQLRNLRKPQFGSHTIERRRHVSSDPHSGLHEYRLVIRWVNA